MNFTLKEAPNYRQMDLQISITTTTIMVLAKTVCFPWAVKLVMWIALLNLQINLGTEMLLVPSSYVWANWRLEQSDVTSKVTELIRVPHELHPWSSTNQSSVLTHQLGSLASLLPTFTMPMSLLHFLLLTSQPARRFASQVLAPLSTKISPSTSALLDPR